MLKFISCYEKCRNTNYFPGNILFNYKIMLVIKQAIME